MLDPIEADKQRILGIKRGAEITQRMQQDAALKAAIALEQEQRAEAQRRQEALAHEAQTRAAAESVAVEKLRALQPLYAQREAAARQVIEAIASLWRVEQEIRDGLQLADRALSSVEPTVEPTQRAAWRQALRDRSGLPNRHVFMAPKQWLTTDGLRAGAAAVAALTAAIILPGRIETPRGDVIDFDV